MVNAVKMDPIDPNTTTKVSEYQFFSIDQILFYKTFVLG